jgi:hypothetical protein
MFRQASGIVRKGTRQMSLGSIKQDFHKVREKWDISHKWVFLRKRGSDDLAFFTAAVLAVSIYFNVVRAYGNMLMGNKVAK